MDARGIIASARETGRTVLDEASGKRVLAGFGIETPRFVVAGVDDDLGALLDGFPFPVVCKVISPEIVHKSDVGGVRIGLRDIAEVEAARTGMNTSGRFGDARIDGYLIEEMLPDGLEIVVGGFLDRHFGPLVMVGLGGIFVEVFEDIAFRICPIEALDAREMLDELDARTVLDGRRGRPAVPRGLIVDALLRIGGHGGLLAALGDDVAELDINPLIVTPERAVAADARFVLASRGEPAGAATHV